MFASLDDFVAIVDAYSKYTTGNRLIFRQNESNKYWLYKCSKRVNCSFESLFVQSSFGDEDHMVSYFTLKRIYTSTKVFGDLREQERPLLERAMGL